MHPKIFGRIIAVIILGNVENQSTNPEKRTLERTSGGVPGYHRGNNLPK